MKDRTGLCENQGEREQHTRYRGMPVPPAPVPSFHAPESSRNPLYCIRTLAALSYLR